MSACPEFINDLGAFAFGDLPPRRMGEVGLHAGGCPDCRVELEEIRSTLDLASLWEVPAPGKEAGILPFRPSRARRWAAAAALLLAAGGAWRMRPQDPVPARLADPAVAEVLREAGRPDLADRLLASCDADEMAAQSPRILIQIRGFVPDAASYLAGKARGGDPAALLLLARAWPREALGIAPAFLKDPGSASAAVRALEACGVETMGLAPALLKAGAFEEAARLLRDGKGRLPLRETLDAWEDAGEPCMADLETALGRVPSWELLELTRRSGHDTAWGLAAGVLARRKEVRLPPILAEGWYSPARTRAATEVLSSLSDPRLSARTCDFLAEAWWKGSGTELPALPGIREALGRKLATSPSRESREALARMGKEADGVLERALREAGDPVPMIRLAAQYGTSALIPAIQARAKADARIRGLAASAIAALPPAGGSTVPIEPYTSKILES